MTHTSVIGLQWGDEAKGKFVDILAEQHDIIVRYQGGNNAGHTVQFQGNTYRLSLLPAGVLHGDKTSVLGPGVVIDPAALLGELSQLTDDLSTYTGRFFVSDRAHVICPWHIAWETVLEADRKEKAIGTTRRGIGTCYSDKMARTHAIRIGDLVRLDVLQTRVQEIVPFKNKLISAFDPDFTPFDVDEMLDQLSGQAEKIAPFVTDTTAFLQEQVSSGSRLLFEGAQAGLLDIDHGTFPYVTSSNSSAAGLHSGSGIPTRLVDRILGVVKAYTTRVGTGPFPTELDNETGDHIRTKGNEFGTVTGRPRRCGWFDAVAAGYSARLSGTDQIVVALLDVLDELDEIKLCEAYDIDGERTTILPSHLSDLEKAQPIYRTLPGWKTDLTGLRKKADLPAEARAYVNAVSELIGVPVAYVSIGPDREQTIPYGD